MTSPDELFPSDAANAISFTDYQAKTESDWKESVRISTLERLEYAEFGFNNNKVTVTEHTEAISTLEDINAASHSTQAYIADIQDMATCPRRDLAVFGWAAQKYVDLVDGVFCAFDDHFHRISTTCFIPERTVGETLGHIYYTPIVVDRVGSIEGLRWFVGVDTSIFSIDYYEVALCALNPSNGNIEKLWGSGNIKDALPSTTDLIEAYMPFGFNPEQVTEPGELLFFVHQQTAPGLLQGSRRLAAAINPPAGRPDQLLDAACYVAEDYSQGIPSTIPFASLARENRFIPWGAVRVFATEEGS